MFVGLYSTFLPHEHRAVTKTSSYRRKVGNWTTSFWKSFCLYFPLNLLNSSWKRVYNFVDCVRIASGVWFCFGHKSFSLSVWYLELPSNDVMTKRQLTSFNPTSHLGAFFSFHTTLKWQLEIWPRTTKKKTTTRNRGDERRIWLFILCEQKCLLLLNRDQFSSCKCWELQAAQHHRQETSQQFCETLNIVLSAMCSANVMNNELKYSFYRQNPAYFPQIYL